jgi:hypothetical protein
MNNSIPFRTLNAVLFVALIAAAPAAAQDKAAEKRAGDDTTKVLVDNDKLRASESTYKPGAVSDMRKRSGRLVRALTDGTVERVYADGKMETINYKAGDVKYYPEQTYRQKNVGKADMVIYTVTPK